MALPIIMADTANSNFSQFIYDSFAVLEAI